jgi:cell shape-determining protein MreC
MDYNELFTKYHALQSENHRLREENKRLRLQLGIPEQQGIPFQFSE